MTDLTTLAQQRLARLVAALSNLRERVREAVAGEMGRAVGEAVRDLLTDALYRRGTSNRISSPTYPPRSRRDFADEPEDPWADDDRDDPPARGAFAVTAEPADPPSTAPPRRRWATALAAGAALAGRLVAARLPTLPALAAGVVACAAVLGGSPIVQTSLATLGVARDLLAVL